MKPFEHNGKKFTNADSWRTAKATQAPAKMVPGPEAMDGGQNEEDGEQVAAEHGPAMEVHTQHDHEMGVHHVHSVHPDGHEHHSDHASAEEAHEHAKKLTGHDEEKMHEEPEDDWNKEPA